MTASDCAAPSVSADRLVRAAAATVAGLTVLRLIALAIDPNSLYADETQYWLWSREFDWGYFSKPPLIAWLIGLTTAVFGSADWAVRLPAPLLHAGTATFLGLTAARLFGPGAGAGTAIAWTTLPAVWLSSSIMSTDAVLLTCWSAALYCLVRVREGGGLKWAAALGLAAGLALLAKYAAIYFLIGAVLSVFIDRPLRRALLSWKGALAGMITAAVIAPNLIWNAANDFATLSHTAANANWGGPRFRWHKLWQFVSGQFGVLGPAFFPLLLAALLAGFAGWRTSTAARPHLMLALFTAPPLLIVTAQSFINRAHANWAVSAYAAGLVLLIAFLLQGGRWRRIALYVSVGLHSLVGLLMMALAASTPLSETAGLSDAFKRLRGWEETTAAVAARAEELGVEALIFDNRNDFHQMQRYAPPLDAELYMWMRFPGARNFAQEVWPMPAGYDGETLAVVERARNIDEMRQDFARFEPAGEIVIDLGGGERRHYRLFVGQGYAPALRQPSREEDDD